MELKLYNTLTRKIEAFKPIKGKEVKMFVCGPTVYNYIHLGNAKTYIQFDIIVKYLRYKGYKVFYLQNITDIDDKTIKKAAEEKTDWKTIAKKYEEAYILDIKNAGVDSINKYARATYYIKEIISQVKRLIQKGYAYKITDGYYFDASKFKDYGKLARRTQEEAEDSLSRIDENLEKKHKADFCLWKFRKENEPYWEVDIGSGRPGWHIEDTAITEKEFGSQYDVHGAATDLMFPHHEAEIAQMEAVSGKKPCVRYWMHAGFLIVRSQKMSKSLENFMTLREALTKYNKQTIRFMMISTHYRKPLEFSEESMKQAKNSVQKINEFMLRLRNNKSKTKNNSNVKELIKRAKSNFEKAMDNDFETHNAITAIFEFIKETNKLISEGKISEKDSENILNFMEETDSVFGILPEKEQKIPKEVKILADKRQKAREEKDFKLADELREKIKQKGYYVDDTEKGHLIKKL